MTPYALDHPAVRAYLERLDAAVAHLPADERIEISEGIRSHLVAALAEASSEADVRSALDALGAPEEIVGTPAPTPRPLLPPVTMPTQSSARGALEVIAVIFLLVGALIVPVVGWFVGVVLLWISKAWTTGEKWLGTLVVPGGLATAAMLAFFMPFGMFGMQTCVGTTVELGDTGHVAAAQSGLQLVTPGCTGGVSWLPLILAVIGIIGPIVTAVYLLRVAGRRPARA